MNVQTDPPGWPPPRTGGEHAIREWLDALAAGRCAPDAFVREMRDESSSDANLSWEVLSLLDQYYRRGKIKADVFQAVKSRLEGSALGANDDAVPTLRPVPPRNSATPAEVPHGPRIVTAPPGSQSRSSNVTAPPEIQHHPSNVTAPAEVPRRPAAGKPKAAARAPAAVAAPREIKIGDVLRNRYRVHAILGQGGMGTVFEAIDDYRLDLPSSGQHIAIKVLHTAVTQRHELLSELQREFQHLQLLSHPNIVRVHEFDRDSDVAFFTMELLSGALLSRVLAARNAVALPRPYALAIIRDAGAAVCHAHSRGVLHGDVNPQNIFITNDGEVRVLDFGSSKKLPAMTSIAVEELTEYAPLATPGYASCEVLEGQPTDVRDDLFALACVAYVLLSGEHPFPHLTAIQARAQKINPARPPGLTGHQWRALREGLQWKRERRPGDVQLWLDRLGLSDAAPRLPPISALVTTTQPRGRTRSLAIAAVIAAVLLVGGGYWAVTDYDSPANALMSLKNQAASEVTTIGAYISDLIAGAQRQSPTVTDAGKPPAVERQNSVSPDQTPAPTDGQGPSARPAEAPAPARIAPPAAAQAPARIAPPAAAQAPARMASPAAAPVQSHPSPPVIAPTTTPKSHLVAPVAAAAADPTIRAGTTGSARIEMTSDTVDVPATDMTALVTVRRKGNTHGAADFTWWTESGTAKPGIDFAPVTPHVEHFADGSNSVNLNISVSGQPRSQSKSFYVVIDQAESGPAMGARTLTLVTIVPPG